MKTKLTLVLAIAALAFGAGTASAGGSKGSIGVGAETSLGTIPIVPGISFDLSGVSMNYDAGEFHVGGLLGFLDGGGDDDSLVAIGGRFYYHIHSTAMSDFGIGGNATMAFIGDGTDTTDNPRVLLLEPGLQLRAFIASNVALSFFGGVSLGLMDADGVVVDGQVTGSAGFHYYFF